MERRKSKREEREVAVIAVIAYVRVVQKRTLSRNIAFSYDTAYSIYAPLTLQG
jgi:hypothetical protein